MATIKTKPLTQYPGIDILKLVAAFFVVANHTGPLLSVNKTADFIVTGYIARLAVPFFFVSSGFFFRLAVKNIPSKQQLEKLYQFTKKTLRLYLFAVIIYLPLNLYSGDFSNLSILEWLQKLFFTGTDYTLWYLPASVMGLWIVYWLWRFGGSKLMLLTSSVLYIIGLTGDSYYSFIKEGTLLYTAQQLLVKLFQYTRNGLFMAPVFMGIGFILARSKEKAKPSKTPYTVGLLLSLAGLFFETTYIHLFTDPHHESMYLFLIPAVYFIFALVKTPGEKGYPLARDLSKWIYIMHLWAILIVRGLAKLNGLEFLALNSVVFFAAVALLAVLISLVMIKLEKIFKQKRFFYAQTKSVG